MDFIPAGLYTDIEASIPIVCVDFVLARRGNDGRVAHVGLIERKSPYGRVWCHLGGRIRRGETVRDAIIRHFDESLTDAAIDLVDDPQPKHVYQWFPELLAPTAEFRFGTDSRKHAVGLSYLVDVKGEPSVVDGGEALTVKFFAPDDLPTRVWPGCEALFAALLGTY